MSYSGNMPDWHQYNPQQSGINNITSTAQNVNSGHLSFISSINSTCPTQLNSLNISSEGLEKHQNDPNFNPRHFQPHLSSNITHGHNAADNTPLASMVQMQNCIGHYGPSNARNPMVDNLNGPMDPRNTAINGLNDELSYRNNQVPLNGPMSHLNGPNMMNMNAPHASIASRNTNVNSHTNRTGPPPSFVSCKGLCCNPDPNISYQQWEKYCSYQNNTAYRENIRSSAGYQTDTRRAFGSDFSFRKDFDGKEVLPIVPPPPPPPPLNAPNTDHRKNFTDFKYRKDRLMRNYSSSMLQNYPVQNYNYNAGDYQKYSYNIKEYPKVTGMNVSPSQAMVKHQEQGFAMPQQKYNSKQVPYQSNAGVMPNSMPSTNVPNPSMIPSAQNTYFNSQYPRNLPTDITHDCQETADNVSMMNRMQTSSVHTAPHSRYQMYQQKIAMQKFSMENDLKELSRIPGYQSHPKYKEYIQKYREILKLQQSVTYQGQMQQTSSCVAATSNVTTSTVPSINLQFDQNGVLINSNYIPEAFSRMQQVMNPQAPMDVSMNKQSKPDGNNVPEMASHAIQKPEQLVSQQHESHAITLCPDGIQKQDRYPVQKSLDQNQFEVQKTAGGSENFGNLDASASNAVVQHKMTKEFPDKPELDVRQFLANWDESEDEDGTSTTLPHAVLSDSTPVVVVGYENVNLSTKTLEGLEVAKPEEITSGVITFESQDKTTNAGVLPAQDCLTISYSTAENVEIAKDSACKEITKEGIVRTGGHIIQCISNGPDEVPTIHIVDNLEIGSILQVTNGQVGETLERQNAVSFFQEGTEETASAITLETDKLKTGNSDESATEYNNDNDKTSNKEKYMVESSSPVEVAETTSQQTSQANVQKMVTLSGSMKDNSDSTQDMNLKKQSSFTSEESHNPDDISLPDLPTSECTPISTTLNTPIHSDNEESSERVQDLTISTNPIEIMQNSPIISFTQSSTKEELYDHLNEKIDEKTAKNNSTDPLDDNEYRAENRFKNNESNNVLDRDAVLDTFEFSTSSDKNNSAVSTKTSKHYARKDVTSTNTNEKTFSLDDEMENTEVTDMRVTLTSGEYELQIVSASTLKSALKNYTNSTISETCVDEPQIAVTHHDASLIQKNSLPEASSKVTLHYSDSIELENALQNITSNSDSAKLDDNESEIIYSEKCIPTEMSRQTNPNTISLSSTNNITAGNSRTGDSCSTKSSESDLLTTPSHNTKHSTLNGDKIKQYDASASDKFSREDSLTKKDVNKSANVENAKLDSKQYRYSKREDYKKSTSKDQAKVSAKKRCLSDHIENVSETIRHNKHSHKEEESHVESVRESDSSRNSKPKVIGNVRIDDAAERMRLLKEYRRIKSKPSSGDAQTKNKDTQEASECTTSKKCYLPSSFNERSVSNDKHLCQKDTIMLKVSEEEERKHANILRTLVTKNVNPDFAIQVTNVNLKLKDNNDHQKDSRYFGEEGKNNSSLDGIKIEINVSCTERNTTEKLLHENIKNAVAETIGHLTSSISANGSARSNSTSITEIPCDKKVTRDNADCRDYERHNLGIESSFASTEHVEHVRNSVIKDQSSADEAKHKLAITTRKEGTTSDETSISLISRKRRSLSSEQKSMSDVREDNGNINAKTESAPSSLEMSRSDHAAVRRRSVHQDAERKVITNSCVNNEELLISSTDNSTSKNVQKKEHQEIIPSFCRSSRNSQDDIASRLSAIPSTSSSAANVEGAACNSAVHFDYDHFDVAPNESDVDTNDKRADRWKRSKRDDDRFDKFDLYKTPSGYVNPSFFSADKLENLNTVPVYTTKDGKITYSPNPRFTYRELLKEARAREGNARELYFARSSPYDYYNCFKLRKIFKRNRDDRKRETDCPVDAKSATKHADYPLPKTTAYKSAHCKFRGTSHLEFFNNDADKLYTSKSSQQETKESNRKNIIDLSFLEKQYNLDSEIASSSKHCKTKLLADNLECEKRYSENSVFDTNLFPSPKASCWDETMESVKSYSSHIDRRNSDNLKELNFNEIFAQKRLDTFSFLSAERSLENHRTDFNESTLRHDKSPLPCDENLQHEQSNTISHEEQNNENNKNDDSVADVDAKSATISEASSIPQGNIEHAEKRKEFQSDEIQSSAILFAEEATQSPKIASENIDSEKDQCLTDKNEDHPMEDNAQICCTILPKENDVGIEDAEQASDENSVMVANQFEPSAEPKDSLGEEECTKAEESALGIREQDDEIKDNTAKDNLEPAMSQETLCHEVTAVSDCKSKEEHVSEPIISTEIDQTVVRENDSCDKEPPSVSQNLLDVANRSLDEESNEQQSRIFENEEQIIKISLNDRGNDEVDNCDSTISTKPVIENVCDLFADEKREQNISEFTVVKSVIKADKKQCQDLEEEKNSKDQNDSLIDSKLLCMDSSDCGIYTEDRCANDLMREFNEDDSMVLMKWEASRIQEDAVNRLCSLDDTSIDFVGVTTSLQDNSLLDNLSISRTLSTVKEPRVSETITELEDKSNNDEAVVSAVEKPTIEKSPAIEEFDKTPSDNEIKEQNQVSSSSSYDKLAYLRATDCNANTKMVPKLVIKKNEASSKFVTKMSSSAQIDHKSISSPSHQPKIPKMIIRNASSRPGTPSIEAVRDDISTQINILDRTSLTNEESYENESESSLQDGYRNKIPKMKIKLDEKHSNKIVTADDSDEDLCARRKITKKTIPKMKIKNSSDGSVCKSSQESSSRRHEEKIPILKLKKQERNRSSSPEATRKRSSSSHSEVPSKKYKKSGRDETSHSARRSNSSESTRSTEVCEAKKNPLVCISEKIPKVIIKRTSASAEFRCELSKDCKKIIAKSAKWQPEVKLERYRSLESMVKDLKLTLSPMSLRAIEKIFANRKDGHRQEKEEDDHRLSRSSSTSNLIPAKHNKQRRMSDYDYRKTSDSSKFNPASSSWITNSDDKTYISPKKNASSKSCGKSTDECQNKSKSQRSWSRDDNNSQTETDVISFDNESNQSFKFTSAVSQHDERKSRSEQVAKTDRDSTTPSDLGQKNVSERSSDSTNFKIAETSSTESCFVKLPNLKEISSEEIDLRIDKEQKKKQDNDSFSSKEKSKIVIKKERLSTSDIDDNDDSTLLQGDICSLNDTPVMLEQEDDFEVGNAVIKIESSDESQSTIEILPASPNDDRDELEDHIIEDDDNEQLYSSDAIPTQFELELEITDNSNIDLLDVPMPKLDPITCHGSRRLSTEESDQTSKAGRCNKSESSSRNRNSVEREKHAANIDVNGDNKSTSHNNPVGSVKDVSSKAPCETSNFIVTRENFCCNDSLVKEVLAAKEALKKCLSLSKCESDAKNIARPKTAAEKKQGLSFDLNSLSETHSKSSEVPRSSNSDVARSCATSKPSKTETNAEKSDKECSKQSKSSLVRKKLKPHEKSEKTDSKKMTKRTYEYTTISLKAVKRFSQTASNENRAVNQNEERKQDTEDQNRSVAQSQNIPQKEKKLSSYKIPKISKSTHQESNVSVNAKEIKTKEDNMPILEPEVDVNFDASSDRETSRSPPMITIHDSDDLDRAESKLIDDNVITSDNKVESDTKDPHKKDDMSVADFITQLAYHEKATIKHRRYCNLCERWFPNTSRHRRHLAGYQHRHIELTQRRSIHALFMLFTGKLCPRLSPTNVVRNDCSVGELTPLQIAIQDITKCYDAQQSPKKQNDK